MIVKVKKARGSGWLKGIKAYDGSITRIGLPIDRNGNLVTGLTISDEERLEKALFLDKGTLNRNSPYWVTKTVDVPSNQVLLLDTDTPEHELDYLILKAQKKVAKSIAELNTGAGAYCEFVMFNDDDEAAKENKRGKNKRLAYSVFDSLSPNEMRDILMVYGRPADSSSNDVVESTLQKMLEEDPSMFLAHANDPAKKTRVFVLSLVRAGILSKKGPAFADYGTEEIIAYNMEEAIKFFDSKANNGKLLQYKELLKNRA